MKNKYSYFAFLLGGMLLFGACAVGNNNIQNEENISCQAEDSVGSANVFKDFDGRLASGCYYVTDSLSGVERTMWKTGEKLYISPKAIVAVANFSSIKIESDQFGKSAILIGLDKEGTEKFAEATEKWVGRQLAFVINDTLFSAPQVNMRIDGGNLMITNLGFTEDKCRELVDAMNCEKQDLE